MVIADFKRRLRPTSDCRCAAEMVAEWLPIA
jgi:hypothetical protein